MEISKEMMDRWIDLVTDKLSSEDNLKMAADYEVLARKYDALASEARMRAETHRRISKAKQ